MTITIVGIQGMDFTNDKGERVQGKKLHCIVEDDQGSMVRGRITKAIFIPIDAKYQAEIAEVGKTYTAYGEPGKKALAVLIEQK